MKDLFISFLNDNGVYDKFVYNLSVQNDGLDFDTYFNEQEQEHLLESIFYDAFTWSVTDDGSDNDDSHQFWSLLSDMWEDVFNTRTK